MAETHPIERGFFREGEDGAVVFFPFGVAQRGYRLPDAAARARAARAVSLLVGGAVGLGVWIAHRLQPLLEGAGPSRDRMAEALGAPLLALAALFGLYVLWAWRFVERFPPSDLRVSREERLDEAARLAEPGKLGAVGVALAALSAALLWIQPAAWWMGALGVALGIGLAVFAARLAQRRRRLARRRSRLPR